MAALHPFADNLPSEVQVPYMPPDFSFIQQQQMRANSIYETGLNEIKNDYSAVINAPVTNGENLDTKQSYIKSFREGLKKTAPTDLTMSQNVLQAENLLSPFWSDQDMLQDMSITKDTHSKLQQAQGDQLSKEEKVRNSYNPWSVARLNYVLEDLKQAKRGNGSIGRVQRSEYLPISDYQAYVDEQDKAMGFKGVTIESVNGPALIKETNGVKAVPQLRSRYDAMLGSKFQAQFSQQGWVMHRQELDNLAKQYPEMSKEQLNQQLSANKYKDIANLYDDQIKRYGSDMYSTYQIPIQAIYELKQKQGGRLTEKQQADLTKLEAGQEQFNARLDQLSTEKEQFMKANPNEKINDIANNPENYYSKLVRDETVKKLADVQATNYSSSIELNKVWDAVSTHRENQANIGLRGKELTEKAREANLDYQAKMDRIKADLLISGINPQTGEKTTPGTGTSDIQLTGQQQTDQQHVDFTAVLNSQKAQLLNVAASSSFGREGTANRLEDIGVSAEDLLQYKTLMSRLYSIDNKTNVAFTQKPEEKRAFQRVRTSLSAYLGRSIPNTYDDVAKAQNEFISNEIKRRSSDLQHPMGEDDPYKVAFTQSKIATDALNGYVAKVNEEDVAIQHLTASDKEKHKMLLNDQGTSIVTPSDMAKYTPALELVDAFGNHKTLSPEEFGSAYLSKDIQNMGKNKMRLNGKDYYISKVNGADNAYGFGESVMFNSDDALNKVMRRFGTYTERDNLNQSLQNSAAGYMPSVKDHTGKTGMDITYKFGSEKVPGNGEKMIMEALNPANYTDIHFVGEKDPISEKDRQVLNALAGSYESIRKNLGQPHYNTVSATGQQVVRFTTENWPDAKGTTTKTIEIPLSPHVTGELLSSIPQSSGLYVYGKILKGEIVKNDDDWEHMGFKYQVVPDNADHPSTVTVKSQHLEVNPATGTEVWVTDKDLPILVTGSGAWNPDQIMTAVSQRGYKSISALTSQRKDYNAKNAK